MNAPISIDALAISVDVLETSRRETAFVRGQLAAVEAELARTLKLVATLTGERDYYQGELGDLRDAVDALTTLRGDALAVAIDDLCRGFKEQDEPSLSVQQEIGAREGRVL